MSSSSTADPPLEALQHLIQCHPLIDNHAHNILSKGSVCDYEKYPFESIISEAQGPALESAKYGLPYARAVSQLAELFECAPDWEQIKDIRSQWVNRDYNSLVRECLQGTHALLLDDLLGGEGIQDYKWHDQFTVSETKRIVRIEEVASDIIVDLRKSMSRQARTGPETGPVAVNGDAILWPDFAHEFSTHILSFIGDTAVVGFKSVICYRTGLDIATNQDEWLVAESFLRTWSQPGRCRIEDKPFNDWLVLRTLELMTQAKREIGISKPLQLHTGLGDRDINLLLSNPAHLQRVIAAYPQADFVLLHSSYPYTREAGYLATVYPNVYLDLGEVFPMVSRDGQESIVRESLEIVPTDHLLWSTDGHFHPETFWIANKQFRLVLEKVLVEYVKHGDYTVRQAMRTAADILFCNSNKLYGLCQVPVYQEAASTVALRSTPDSSLEVLTKFLQSHPQVQFIWVQWVDYTATVRVRMLPVQKFVKLVGGQRRLGITLGVLHMLQNDRVVRGGTCAGQFYLLPDLDTLSLNAGLASKSASVMTFWRTEEDTELEGCPRTTLRNVVRRLASDHGIETMLGFEVEVVFLKPVIKKTGEGRIEQTTTEYVPFVTNHSWSQMTSDTRRALPLLEDITQTLAEIDIHVEQFHAESGPAQFEFVLPPGPPLEAVDTLLKARQVIVHVAENHSLRATFHPRPSPYAAGTASHAHISIIPINTPQENSFLAGILAHFPSILAFTLPQEVSYERVRSGIWSGGEWITWGTQNRETPVRKIKRGHWEIKSVDGLANMYLAMAAVLAAGYLGLSDKTDLSWKDCQDDTSSLTDNQRLELGITKRLPTALEESLFELKADTTLQDVLGASFVKNYIAVKDAEREFLAGMEEEDRRRWLIERY